MSASGQTERATQNRVIALFRDRLHYDYLGDKTKRSAKRLQMRCFAYSSKPIRGRS